MPATLSASAILEAYTAFVTEFFMTPYGCNRPDVSEMSIHLQESGTLAKERERLRSETDAVIERVFGCTAESRPQVFLETDPKLLSLVFDRTLAGLEALKHAARARIALPCPGAPLLPDFFRQVLLQKRS